MLHQKHCRRCLPSAPSSRHSSRSAGQGSDGLGLISGALQHTSSLTLTCQLPLPYEERPDGSYLHNRNQIAADTNPLFMPQNVPSGKTYSSRDIVSQPFKECDAERTNILEHVSQEVLLSSKRNFLAAKSSKNK